MSETAPVAISQTGNVAVSDRPSDKAADGRKLPVRKRSSREKWAKRKKRLFDTYGGQHTPGLIGPSPASGTISARGSARRGGCRHGRPGGEAGRALREVDGPRRRLGGVADVWLEPHGGADEPHAGVARRRGPPCPARCAGRHLGVWRHGTIVRCAVPRAGCPGHGARTVRTPWEARPSSHLAAPFEARAIAAVMSGATAEAVASRPREADGRTWAALRRAAAGARRAADHSGVARAPASTTPRAPGAAPTSP